MRLSFLVVCKLAVKAASGAELQSSSMSIGIHAQARSRSQDAQSAQKSGVLGLFVLLILALVPAVFQAQK